jgi:Arc/MetJ family transcription regulator
MRLPTSSHRSTGCHTQILDTSIFFRKNICMRTTLNIDEKSLATAARLTGVRTKTKLVRMGLEALIARESARRLAALGGSDPKARPIPRRRPR